MTIEFDENGKFFTEIVTKIGVQANIQTTTHRISGLVHIRPSERFKDELDRDVPFLAVTSATVFGAQGEILFQAEFLSVRRSQIVWVIPEDQNGQKRSGEGEQA
jgi:hypothetical protein